MKEADNYEEKRFTNNILNSNYHFITNNILNSNYHFINSIVNDIMHKKIVPNLTD